jgi:hypothetical protein
MRRNDGTRRVQYAKGCDESLVFVHRWKRTVSQEELGGL